MDFSTPCSLDLSRGELTKSGFHYPPWFSVGLQTQSLLCRTALRVWKGHSVQHDTVLEMLLLPCVSKPPANTACSQPLSLKAPTGQSHMPRCQGHQGGQDTPISVQGQV